MNKSLVSLINLAGATAVGLCGKDALLLTACPASNAAALGFVGEVSSVNPAILHPILAHGHIPVIASVAADQSGQVKLQKIIGAQLSPAFSFYWLYQKLSSPNRFYLFFFSFSFFDLLN